MKKLRYQKNSGMRKFRYKLIDMYSLLAISPKRHRQQQQQKKSDIQKAGLAGAALKMILG